MVVDDDAAQRELMRTVLRNRGFEVREAVNGWEGIMSMGEREYAAIVVDLKMHRGNGEFVLQWMLQNRLNLRDRLLIVTGGHLDRGLEIFLERLQLRVLEKPYLLADLADAVESLAASKG